jgi:SAM-dependent methyltransferase
MRRLNDGVFALVEMPPEDSELASLDGETSYTVSARHADELALLAHGIPDDEEPGPLFAQLESEGLAAGGLSAVDGAVLERLAWLGRGFSWLVDEDPRGAELVELLRRGHARRKVFVQAFGQTPCLPESAAARVLELTRHLEPGARVLTLGDDDLLCMGLAHLGYRVTACDIDPLLIAFLDRVAKEEGLDVDARVLDLLAPLPAEEVGAYDAVLTDPMSYEDCLVAFVGRALALTRPGGLVLSCVHPAARHVFRRVLSRLPAKVRGARSLLSAYYFDRYIENAYRSDLCLMERTDDALPFAPDEQIPFEPISEGRLSEHEHGLFTVRGMRSRIKGAVEPEEAAAVLREAWTREVTDTAVANGQGHAHVFLSTKEGHAAVSIAPRGFVGAVVYPAEREGSDALLDGLDDIIRPMSREGWFVSSLSVPPRVL